MTNVSKKEIGKAVWNHIDSQLGELFARSHTKQGSQNLFHALLTESERIMLAKRLAIIFMLYEDLSYYRIAQTLKVSKTTVKRIHCQLLNDEYSAIEKVVKRKKEREEFWKTFNKVLRAGMPPIAGRGRWKWLYEIEDKYK